VGGAPGTYGQKRWGKRRVSSPAFPVEESGSLAVVGDPRLSGKLARTGESGDRELDREFQKFPDARKKNRLAGLKKKEGRHHYSRPS